MKRAVLVSYWFPPCNLIPSYRVKSFADNLNKFGIETTVITRHWQGDENSLSDAERLNFTPLKITLTDNYKLIQLPYVGKGHRFCKPLHRFPLISKFIHLIYTVFGIFSPQESADECFYQYLNKYLSENHTDYLFVSSSPLNIVRLGYRLRKTFDFDLVIDFRDLWDNTLLNSKLSLSFEQKIKNVLYEYYLKKWLKSASLITSVSNPILDEIKRLIPKSRTALVMNGFESKLRESFNEDLNTTQKFTFSVIGTLYPGQDLSIMIKGLNKFLEGKDLNLISLKFIGCDEIPEIGNMLRSNLPKNCTEVTKRIARDQAIEETKNSNVLFYAGWKGFRGIVSGKIFEYICSGKKILIAPNDFDSIEKIVTETNTGKMADSVDEFVSIMEGWFNEWSTKGFLAHNPNSANINFYSREKQTEILAKEILKIE